MSEPAGTHPIIVHPVIVAIGRVASLVIAARNNDRDLAVSLGSCA